jgi:hypothetical protein
MMKLPNLSFVILALAFLFTPKAFAQTMENDMYRVQMGNLDSFAGQSSGSNYNLSITSGESATGLFTGTNYKVKAGFQYVPRTSPFTFTISNTTIDFGNLSPTNPVTRTTTITVNNSSAKSYKVTAAENHQLLVPSTGASIPDTTCDDGNCTETKSAKWTNTLTYGFGYRCDGSCVANDTGFKLPDYYKQFSDTSHKEPAATIMSGGTGNGLKATITYKVNISSSQPAGTYTNTVTYLATPSY